MTNETRARYSKHLHVALAVSWTAMIPVTLLTGLQNSVPFLVFLSIYALIVSHLGAAAGKSAKEEAADAQHDTRV